MIIIYLQGVLIHRHVDVGEGSELIEKIIQSDPIPVVQTSNSMIAWIPQTQEDPRKSPT